MQLPSSHDIDIMAQTRLLVHCREAYFREHPNEAPDPARLKAALAQKSAVQSEKLRRWFHVKVSLGTPTTDDSKVQDKLRLMDAAASQKWVLQGAWCLEYINKSLKSGHPHIHFLVESKKCKKHIIRDISSTLQVLPTFVYVKPVLNTYQRSHTAGYLEKNRLYDIAYRARFGQPTCEVNLCGMTREDFQDL